MSQGLFLHSSVQKMRSTCSFSSLHLPRFSFPDSEKISHPLQP